MSSLARSAVKLIGGVLATNGINRSSVTQIVIGIVTALMGLAWSHWEHSPDESTIQQSTQTKVTNDKEKTQG